MFLFLPYVYYCCCCHSPLTLLVFVHSVDVAVSAAPRRRCRDVAATVGRIVVEDLVVVGLLLQLLLETESGGGGVS